MQQHLKQLRPAGPQGGASHVAYLLNDILPVHLVVDPFSPGQPAQQIGLAF
jgi:hypothetical protein